MIQDHAQALAPRAVLGNEEVALVALAAAEVIAGDAQRPWRSLPRLGLGHGVSPPSAGALSSPDGRISICLAVRKNSSRLFIGFQVITGQPSPFPQNACVPPPMTIIGGSPHTGQSGVLGSSIGAVHLRSGLVRARDILKQP